MSTCITLEQLQTAINDKMSEQAGYKSNMKVTKLHAAVQPTLDKIGMTLKSGKVLAGRKGGSRRKYGGGECTMVDFFLTLAMLGASFSFGVSGYNSLCSPEWIALKDAIAKRTRDAIEGQLDIMTGILRREGMSSIWNLFNVYNTGFTLGATSVASYSSIPSSIREQFVRLCGLVNDARLSILPAASSAAAGVASMAKGAYDAAGYAAAAHRRSLDDSDSEGGSRRKTKRRKTRSRKGGSRKGGSRKGGSRKGGSRRGGSRRGGSRRR